MKHKITVGLALAGSLIISTVALAAGLWPDFPIVGGATYCAGSSNSATGTIIGLVTGCPNTVPAGPSIVTGNEQIPADTRLSSGVNPQTVLLPMASLNALPITIQVIGGTSPVLSAANTSGGVCYRGGNAAITAANITLPTAPIDGQQFAICSNANITTLSVTATVPTSVSVANTPTALTVSATGAFGYRYMYNAAGNIWLRLQ